MPVSLREEPSSLEQNSSTFSYWKTRCDHQMGSKIPVDVWMVAILMPMSVLLSSPC